jgi:hypothetical protein
LKKSGYILLCLLLPLFSLFAQQTRFSLSTDVNGLRSVRKQQHFWAFGQTVSGQFHFTPKDGAYVWLVYYTNGKFRNDLTATAKQPLTTPQQIPFENKASMTFKEVSMGWKHYLKGTPTAENKWNLYASAGWGLMLGRIENAHSVSIDTSSYYVQVLPGKANFKRLTIDLAFGFEKPAGGDVYVFMEGRTLVPITDYPSDYIYIYNNAPLTVTLSLGLRILFE